MTETLPNDHARLPPPKRIFRLCHKRHENEHDKHHRILEQGAEVGSDHGFEQAES